MFYGGIDVSKHQHEVCMLDPEGECVLRLRISNNLKGFEKLLKALKTLEINPDNVLLCLEATGHYWLSLFSFLEHRGFQLHVINPIQSDALRNLYVRKAKTDTKDALLLADMVRLGFTSQTKLAPETTLKLQTLSRARFSFVHQVAGLKNQILGILDRIFPEYAKCFSSVFVQTSRELLKTYTEPEELAQVDLAELTQFLAKHSRGRLGQDRAEQIKSLAQGTVGIRLALDAFTLQLRLLVEQVSFIEDQISTIEEAMDQVMEELRPEGADYRHVLETIPGIGPVLAASIIGEIGDIDRFRSAKALVAFAGLDATVRSSGQFEGTKNRMSKRGSPVLRHSLWLAAVSARRFNPELKEYYELKRSQGKHSNIATGAVARRMAHLVHSIWKSGRPFDPEYKWKPSGHS